MFNVTSGYLRPILVFLFVILSIGILARATWADEVYFVNGDRVSGTIVRMAEESLILATTYSGEIRIEWGKVKGLSTTTPLTIELADGSQYKGPVSFTESEGFRMAKPKELVEAESQEDQTKEFFLDSIAAINPMPWFRYDANAFLGGNRTAGNSETQAINGSTEATMRFGGHRVGLGGRYNYGESVGQVTARNSRGSLNYDYFLADKIFLGLDELFEQDSFQDLTLRSSTSVGLGYQFFDDQEHELAMSSGLGFVHQDFKTRPTVQSPAFLWSIDWGYWIISDRVRIFLDHRGFKDFGDESTALRVNSSQGIRIELNQHLYVNFAYDIRFNSQPLFENKKFDEAFIFGIGWAIES